MGTKWRDMFPKMGLLGKYIGDRYPRCADRPKQHFLQKGARYVLLGSSSTPEKHEDPLEWANDPEAVRLRLEKNQPSKHDPREFYMRGDTFETYFLSMKED